MSAERVVARYLSAKSVMMWPKLRGNLIEFTRRGIVRKDDPYGEEVPFDRHDTFEMTGRVVHGNEPSEYLFEAFLDSPSELYWVAAKMRSFGMVPHNFITPQNEELGPEFFRGATSVGQWEERE